MVKGFRTVRQDWGNDSIYPRRRKPAPPKPPTDEERARSKAFFEKFERDLEASRLQRIRDAEARQAVEGNTDLNHDNLDGRDEPRP